MNNTQTYELAYLALQHLSAKEVEDLQSTLSEVITKAGGQVLSEGDINYIPLAYEMIKKVGSKNTRHDQAYFSWIKFTIAASATTDVDAVAKAHKDILRYMVVKTDANDELTDLFVADEEEAEEVAENQDAVETETEESQEEEEKTESVVSDDLTKIEGIGPVIATTLTNAGIANYAQLAEASVDSVVEIIAGVRGNHDPATWAQQAALARDGKWDELQTLQDELDGGKEA